MLDSFARATLVTVVPLQAYALLGDPLQYVLSYFLISFAALVGSMTVPWLIRKIHHRGTFILGNCCMMGSSFLLSGQDIYWFIPGLTLQFFAAATIAISLNLYVLTNIPREEFTRFEPVRILFFFTPPAAAGNGQECVTDFEAQTVLPTPLRTPEMEHVNRT